jgi:hypothetical protein
VHGRQQLSLFNAHYDERMRAWMRSHKLALRGVPPENIRTVTGLVETAAYLDRGGCC